jgi:DNA-binding transcriptional MerR regulator
MHIGVIAKKAGVSVRTIRYYEELGLIHPSGHSTGGFRLYGEATLKRLELIGFLKGLDLTLLEIRRIFDAGKNSVDGKESLLQLMDLLCGRLQMVSSRLDALAKMKRDLAAVIDVLGACGSCGETALLHSTCCDNCVRLRCGQNVPEMLKVLLEGGSVGRSGAI